MGRIHWSHNYVRPIGKTRDQRKSSVLSLLREYPLLPGNWMPRPLVSKTYNGGSLRAPLAWVQASLRSNEDERMGWVEAEPARLWRRTTINALLIDHEMGKARTPGGFDLIFVTFIFGESWRLLYFFSPFFLFIFFGCIWGEGVAGGY